MKSLYEHDFYSWTKVQARALRAASAAAIDVPEAIDWANIAEELEGLARSEERELQSRYRSILLHLLVWKYHPSGRTRGARDAIQRERDEIPEHLAENPGLAARTGELAQAAYRLACREAARQTGLALEVFPEEPPFSMQEALDPAFWPQEAGA